MAELSTLGAVIKTAYEGQPDTNAFTDAEQSKLNSLVTSRFLGVFATLTALQTAHPAPVAGSFAHVDVGAGTEITVYVWDSTDNVYYPQAKVSELETAATIKTKYESNADTNAFTDAEQTKLAGIAVNATNNTGALANKNTVATADIDDGAVTLVKLADRGAYTIVGRPSGTTGAVSEITAGVDSVLRRSGSGDIAFGSLVTNNLGNNIVTNAKAAQMAQNTIKGRITASTGNPEDLTAAQVASMLPTFTSSAKGLVPVATGGGTTEFLRKDGNWAVPSGGGGSSATAFYNNTGATLVKGTPVCLAAYDVATSTPGMAAADADGSGTTPVLGILGADCLNAASAAPIINGGEVIGLDTSAYTLNQVLYVGTTAGTLTGTRPLTGFIQPVAIVTRVDATAGEIVVWLQEPQTILIEDFTVAVSNEVDNLTTGTAKTTFRMTKGFTLTAIRANVSTAPTGSSLIVDVNENGVSVFSTTLSIDATEKTSVTAAVPAVISDAVLADDAEITIDIDQIGSTIAGKGLKLTFYGYRT